MRPEKQLLLDEIHDQIKAYASFVILSYKGFTANVANDFRSEMIGLNCQYEVVRKRLLLKAAEKLDIGLTPQQIPGHIGLLLLDDDSIDALKKVFDYQKDLSNAVEVIGGHFNGQLLDAQEVEQMSKLPTKNEMRAQFLGLLEAPMAQTLSTMEALVCSVIYCLDNKAKEANEDS